MKLVQDAGFKTAFYCLAHGFTAQALTEDGDEIETIAYCVALTECLAAARLAVREERETRERES